MSVPSVGEGLASCAVLNNHVHMPWLGLGVWQAGDDAETERAVASALQAGYRSIDTARMYGNERGVGRGIRVSGIPREEVFITTKAWTDDIREHRIEAAFHESLNLLGVEEIDLYLLHWAIPGEIEASWHVMERLYHSGRVRAIGVCNHMVQHLDLLLRSAEIFPAINQIEYHPYFQSVPLLEYCRGKGIQVEAWSPLMRGGAVLADPVLWEIARMQGKTVAQVVIRWLMQLGIIAIPKTIHPARMRENAAVFDFTLSDAQMTAIGARNKGARVGPDPHNVHF